VSDEPDAVPADRPPARGTRSRSPRARPGAAGETPADARTPETVRQAAADTVAPGPRRAQAGGGKRKPGPAEAANPAAAGQAQAGHPGPAGQQASANPAKPARPRTRSSRPRASRAKKGPGGPVAPPGLGPGAEVAGYRLDEQIGQGGMAVVFRARDQRLDRQVALKLLAPGLAADVAFRQRFIRESRAAAAVDHPHIIPVYDAGDAGGVLFIAMRFVHGGDVRSLLAEQGALPVARAWSIVTQVGSALDAAHAHGLVHRDVKPANMLLDASVRAADQTEHVYLSDFGISKQSLSTSHLTSTGQFVGTLDYIAPEQIDGRSVDGRADQYSLACAAFELLCGTPPFRQARGFALIGAHLNQPPPSLTAQRGDLPPAVDLVLATAMAKSADERYASCGEFAADLGRALGLIPGEVTAPGQEQLPRAWPPTEIADRPSGPGPAPAPSPPAQPSLPAASPWPAAIPAAQQAPPPGSWPQAGQQQPPPGSWPQAGQQQPPPGSWPQGPPGTPGTHPGPYPGYGPYGPYATYPPGGPTAPGGPHRPRSRGVLAASVIAAVAVVAAGATVAAVLLLHRSAGSSAAMSGKSPAARLAKRHHQAATPAHASASAEATTVNNLLKGNLGSRVTLGNAVSDVKTCTNLSFAVTQIQTVDNSRATEFTDAKKLQTGAIPNGGALKSELLQSLQISVTTDGEYLSWAQQQETTGCASGESSSYYQQALADDSTATTDKTMFVDTWNPIAIKYGLTQYQAGQI
jgi:serine/threonine protein kinase